MQWRELQMEVTLPERLCCQFPHVEADVITAVLESAGDAISAVDVLQELQAEVLASQLSSEAVVVPVNIGPVSGTSTEVGPWVVGDGSSSLGVVGEAGKTLLSITVDSTLLIGNVVPKISISMPSGELWPIFWHTPPLIFRPPLFGWYRIILDGHSELPFKVSSVVGDYAEAFDEFVEALTWIWDDSNWTEELQDATLNLIMSVDEFMNGLDSMMGPLLPMLGRTSRSVLETPRRQIEHHLGRALDQHNVTAVGMTHGALRDLLKQIGAMSTIFPMMQGMMRPVNGNSIMDILHKFKSTGTIFESARQRASSQESRQRVRTRLLRLISATQQYVTHLRATAAAGTSIGNASTFVQQWDSPGGLLSQLQCIASEDKIVDLQLLATLQGGGNGMLMDILSKFSPLGRVDKPDSQPVVVESMPFIDLDVLRDRSKLNSMVTRWAENLVGDVVVIGSPLSPMSLSASPSEIESSIRMLRNVLECGFGYVTQDQTNSTSSTSTIQHNQENKVEDGVLLAVFDRDRATLPLHAQTSFIADRRRRNRLRDVARVLRSQHKSGRQFSLRINSDFSKALTLLREHHEDSWVGSTLESIWGQMFKSSDLVIFELWIREGENEQMIAADFGHPHSTFGFYVATRFFDRNYKTCMPGFILAYVEAQVLAQHGF